MAMPNLQLYPKGFNALCECDFFCAFQLLENLWEFSELSEINTFKPRKTTISSTLFFEWRVKLLEIILTVLLEYIISVWTGKIRLFTAEVLSNLNPPYFILYISWNYDDIQTLN